MILNVSGRTDIVAFYMDWFMDSYKRGEFYVRNPFYKKLVNRISLSDVDLIVFCTKNPKNLLKVVEEIKVPFIVHVTLTPYGKDIEPNVPNKKETIEVIKELSKKIGKDRIFLRYDPMFISEKYNVEYHVHAFNEICSSLNGYINSVIISFMDEYKNVKKNSNVIKKREFTEDDYKIIGESFSKIASFNNLTVQTCSEEVTLFEYGFLQNDCITTDLVYKFTGKEIKEKWTSRNNKNCHCIKMYDIGEYNTCTHLCKYCYANFDEKCIVENIKKHKKNSTLLIGDIQEDDIIKDIK
jgi:DNA repair photolyase